LNESMGMTVIMVTHERPAAERYVRRMIFLGDGRVLSEQAVTRTVGGAQ